MDKRLAVAAMLLLLGCGGADSSTTAPTNPPPEEPTTGSPASLQIVAGDEQTGEVDAALGDPVVATVVDAEGQAVPDATVSWVVTEGGGSVFAVATNSDQDGRTQNIWTLGTTAGTQTLEVRWVDPSSGDALVLGTFSATAEPGPAVSLSLESPRQAILEVGDTFQALVSGQDEFGNVIPSNDVEVVWSSSDETVASVDDTGLVTATGGGSVSVVATADTASANTDLVVNATVPAVFPTIIPVREIAATDDRILGIRSDAGGDVYSFQDDKWVLEATLPAEGGTLTLHSIVALPNGTFLLSGQNFINNDRTALVWSSNTPGVWPEEFRKEPNGERPYINTRLSRSASNTAALRAVQVDSAADGAGFDYFEVPRVWRRDAAGTWQNLNHPEKAGTDFLQVGPGPVIDSDEIYMCGIREERQASGSGDPAISFWDGVSWTFLDYSGFMADQGATCNSGIVSGASYGTLWDSRSSSDPDAVFRLADGAVLSETSVPEEFLVDLERIDPLPSGRLFLTYGRAPETSTNLEPDLRWQTQEGSWESFWLPGLDQDSWRLIAHAVNAASGEVVLVARERSTGNEATYILSP